MKVKLVAGGVESEMCLVKLKVQRVVGSTEHILDSGVGQRVAYLWVSFKTETSNQLTIYSNSCLPIGWDYLFYCIFH